MAAFHGLQNEQVSGVAAATVSKTADSITHIVSRAGAVPSRAGTATPNRVLASMVELAEFFPPGTGTQPQQQGAGKRETLEIRTPKFLASGSPSQRKQSRPQNYGFLLLLGLFPE